MQSSLNTAGRSARGFSICRNFTEHGLHKTSGRRNSGASAQPPAITRKLINVDKLSRLHPLPGQRRPWDKDIVYDDLAATVEAHRRTNEQLVADIVGRGEERRWGKGERDLPQLETPEENGSEAATGLRAQALGKARPSEQPVRIYTNHAIAELESSDGRERNRTMAAPRHQSEEENDLAENVTSPKMVKYKTSRARRIINRSRQTRTPAPEEYEGQVIDLVKPWSMSSYQQALPTKLTLNFRPWTRYVDGYEKTGLEQLSAEISHFEKWMLFRQSEKDAVQHCIDQIEAIASAVLSSNPLVIHGSHATGLATPLSDLDFCITDPNIGTYLAERGPSPSHPMTKRTGRRALTKLENALKASRLFHDFDMVYASVSVLTFKQRTSDLSVQFVFGATVNPTVELTKCYLTEYPGLRPLYILLRHMLQIRGLTTVFEGGIGSYSFFVMVLAALQHSPSVTARDGLGKQLLTVLDFWANADTYQVGYALDPARMFSKQLADIEISDGSVREDEDQSSRGLKFLAHENWKRMNSASFQGKPRLPYLLCLQDPSNPVNDLGKRSHSIKHVQAVFKDAHLKLLAVMDEWDSASADERKDVVQSLLHPLVGANYHSFQKMRQRLMRASPTWVDEPVRS